LRSHLIELVVVFVGVALAFAVENFREDLSNRSVEAQYLRGFRQDLLGNLTVENGFRLIVANLEYEKGGLLKNLETAQSQVESLLQIIPAD
jgi:hypothetical protein